MDINIKLQGFDLISTSSSSTEHAALLASAVVVNQYRCRTLLVQ